MVKNLSLSQGVPSTLESAEEQHEKLANALKNNEVYLFGVQNRGYLALEKATGQYKGYGYFNILYNSKPSKKGIIKLTKV